MSRKTISIALGLVTTTIVCSLLYLHSERSLRDDEGTVEYDEGKAVRVCLSRVSSRTVRFVSHRPTVTSLSVDAKSLNTQQLQMLCELSHVHALDLTGVNLASANLDALATTSSLESLQLGKTNLDDKQVLQLSSLESLKHLILAKNPITDASILRLSLNKLELLDLSGTSVSESIFQSDIVKELIRQSELVEAE